MKITLIAAVVALLCAALCGCSLIQGILHPEGKFALSESEITLKIGETYDVTLSNGRTDEFTLSTSDKTKVEIYGRTSIKAVGKTKTAVTITATNGKGDTAELKVNVDYADVSTVKSALKINISCYNRAKRRKESIFPQRSTTARTPTLSFRGNSRTARAKKSRRQAAKPRRTFQARAKYICHRNGGRKIRNRRILRL